MIIYAMMLVEKGVTVVFLQDYVYQQKLVAAPVDRDMSFHHTGVKRLNIAIAIGGVNILH